jgi:protocatechuate 3,4-dioxygenase beta subunit
MNRGLFLSAFIFSLILVGTLAYISYQTSSVASVHQEFIQPAGASSPSDLQQEKSTQIERTLTLQTVDDAGNPVPNTRVQVLHSDRMIVESVSDASGSLQLTFVEEGRLGLSVQAEGYLPESIPLPVDNHLKIILQRLLTIRGTVCNERGEPLPGATLTLIHQDERHSAQGSPFVFEKVRALPYTLLAEHPGYLTAGQVVQGGEEVNICLTTVATLRIFVTNTEQQPVAKAAIHLQNASGEELLFATARESDQQGREEILNLRPGLYIAWAEHLWFGKSEPAEILIDRATEELFIILPGLNRTISGRVMDAVTKLPLPSVRVIRGREYGREGSTIPLTELVETTTDSEGFYLFENVERGRYILYVGQIDGYVSGNLLDFIDYGATGYLHVAVANEDVRNVDFLLQRSAVISGQVIDAQDSPVPQAEVKLFFHRGRDSIDLSVYGSRTKTDKSGYYEVPCPLEPNIPDNRKNQIRLVARAYHPRYGMGESEPLEPKLTQTLPDINIRLQTRAVITGTVGNQQGQPIAGAFVQFTKPWTPSPPPMDVVINPPPSAVPGETSPTLPGTFPRPRETVYVPGERYHLITSEQGEYSLYLDESTELSALAYAPGYLRQERESIQVTLGQEPTVLNFVLQRGQEDTLEGIVVDEQDNPLPGVELSLEDNSYYEEGRKYEHHQTTSTDASGFFKFDTGYYMMKLKEPQGSSYVHHIFLRAFRNEPEYTTSIPIVVSNAPSDQTIASAGHYEEQRSYPLGAKNIKIVKRRQSHIPDHMFESFMDYVNFQGEVRDPDGKPIRNYQILVLADRVFGITGRTERLDSPYFDWTPVRSESGMFFLEKIPVLVDYMNTSNYYGGFSRMNRPPDLRAETPKGTHDTFRILVRREGSSYVVSTDRLNPQPGETLSDIRLILGQPAVIRGRVIDRRSGQPVAGALVNAMLPSGRVIELNSRENQMRGRTIAPGQDPLQQYLPQTITGNDGTFELQNVPVPSAFLSFEAVTHQRYIMPAHRLQYGEHRDVGEVSIIPIQ